MKIRLALLGISLIAVTELTMATQTEGNLSDLETVRLQLKWFHSFQFAGYYAAKQQGYYAEEGLDVHILERNPKLNIVQQVLANEVQYGVEDTGIIVQYANNDPIRALAAIFQHNPLIFISKQSSGIISPYEMAGKRIMMYGGENAIGSDEAPLRAMLVDNDVTEDKYTQITPSFNYQDLIDDKVDVIAAYVTDQPFFYKSKNFDINIINPQNYGIDFYGDILFTSQQELEQHPNRAQAFRRASLKGWQYALDHTEQIIQLIHNKYQSRSSVEHLRFEAEQTRKLILHDIIPLGQIQVKRLRKVADTYANLKISRALSHSELAAFIVEQPQTINLSQQEQQWLLQNPVVHLGIDRNFAPYEWIDENNNYAGITVDYIRLLEQRLKIRFEITQHHQSWPDLLEAARQNKVDMLFSLIKTSARAKYLNFTNPYYVSPAVIISGQAQGYIGSLNRLAGKTVAVQKGHSTHELLNQHYPDITVHTTDSIAAALNMVESGKAHAYVGDATSASYVMQKQGIKDLMFSGQTEYLSEFRIGIPKDKPELLSIMNKALASISQKEKNEIHNHWQEVKLLHGIRLQTIIKYVAGVIFMFVLFAYWIIRLRKSEASLRRSESNLKAIYNAEPECIKVISAEGNLLKINPAGIALYTDQQNALSLVGQQVENLIAAEYHNAFKAMSQRVLSGAKEKLVYQTNNACGQQRWLEAHAVPLHDPVSGKTNVLAVARDITDKKRADEKIWKQANYDTLTDLPNRRLFNEHLLYEIKLSQRSGSIIALMFLDLDHFKQVNDEFGHQAGDILLQQVAQRIRACVRETDTVARLSGDEFTVILSKLEERQSIDRIATKIINALAETFNIDNDTAHISVSMGISIFPDDALNSDELLRNADQAMYIAKQSGRNQFNYFTQSMQDKAMQRLHLQRDLHVAKQQQQLQLRYQPIVNLASGKIKKVEVLLCWYHPQRGWIKPAEFIPIAEESGLITSIGDWVFKQAIKQLKDWQQKYNTDIQISINKSPAQFNIKHNQYDCLQALKDYAVQADKIIVEITERLLLDASEQTTQRLLQYIKAGVQLAIDDFGTGYSALSYLNKIDINYIKIDSSYTQHLQADSRNRVFTEAITVMAHKLGLEVIAKGIETEQQKQLLIAAGCDYAQGYLIHKPLSAEEFEQLLK